MSDETARIHVLLPKRLLADLDRVAGPHKRSEFLVKAVEMELQRRDRVAAFDAVAGSLKDVDIPGWETPESTVEWVREQRRDRDDPWGLFKK